LFSIRFQVTDGDIVMPGTLENAGAIPEEYLKAHKNVKRNIANVYIY